ncbi:MAG: alpha/beta fold hydrolase [Pseudomonadota bacterium]
MSFAAFRSVVACLAIAFSLWVLESARNGVEITPASIKDTPVTRYASPDADGQVILIAHGFAGSQQMMQGYALPLARAGYQVYSFEFLGHGRHRVPMSGDVSAIDGTTRLLMEQTSAVIDALGQGRPDIGLLGHSMATDILVRVAENRSDIGPMVLVSAFSQKITANHPPNLLLITGAWEAGLRSFALSAVQMIDPDASESKTVRAGPLIRRAVAAPFAEHASILQSRVARREATDWFDAAYGRAAGHQILPTGWAILGLLAGLVLLFPTVARQIPHKAAHAPLTRGRLALLCLLPTCLTPFLALPLKMEVLPVLVADYLALHLAIFGVIQLVILRRWAIPFGAIDLRALVLLLSFCALFGVALDRYAANFWPTPERVWIIAAIALGAIPYMLADAAIAHNSGWLGRFGLRSSLLGSLGIAVLLDFEGLFFLLMIAPVLVLFYMVFATMGRACSLRSGPLSAGLALGLVLAWALGVSFPMFQA